MAASQNFKLRDGSSIPAVGFGTWQAKPHEVESAVEIALKSGYRHLDCAAIYQNETEVGAGIKKSGVDRKDIYITSKLWNSKHSPDLVEPAVDKTLRDLGTDYLDLYLMHWPVPGDDSFPLDKDGVFDLDRESDVSKTWEAMVGLIKTGKVRSVGVSNFNVRRLKDLLSKSSVVPVVNQIEAHPYLQQPDLFQFCKEKDILIEAYSPLGNNTTGEPRTVDDSKVHELANKISADPGQLLISWGVQRGTVVLPKSVTEHRIISNFQAPELPAEIMKELDALERHRRFNFPIHWGADIFDEVGEAKVKEAALQWAKDKKAN